jgi:hypothetical protein
MKKLSKPLCSAFCFLSLTLPNGVSAMSLEEFFDKSGWQEEQPTEEEKEYRLAYATGDFSLEPVSMAAGKPINFLLLYVSGPDGKIIKDAQVITTIIDQHGNQQANRARPYKYGYTVAVDQLLVGQYRVEAEIITNGQLLTEEFKFNKAG